MHASVDRAYPQRHVLQAWNGTVWVYGCVAAVDLLQNSAVHYAVACDASDVDVVHRRCTTSTSLATHATV